MALRFVDTEEGRLLNSRFRKTDHATNVLSFMYDDDEDGLRGDIVLCAPILREEAGARTRTLAAHCAHLVVHGMLHLQSYDHQRAAQAAKMERREVAILATLGFSNPYAAEPPNANS